MLQPPQQNFHSELVKQIRSQYSRVWLHWGTPSVVWSLKQWILGRKGMLVHMPVAGNKQQAKV